MRALQELVETEQARPVINTGWHIGLAEPNIELQVSIILKDRGYESFCPAEYRPKRTNRMENGRRIYENRARAMLPGYLFIRFKPNHLDFDGVKKVHGIRGFMRVADSNGDLAPAGLSNSEVERLKGEDAAALEAHQRLMAKRAAEEAARLSGKPEVEFAPGKQVRIDGPHGESWIGEMVQARGRNKIEIFTRNTKIILPHNKIHALESAACE